MDELIRQYRQKLQEIYDNRTAGDGTFTGILADFARDVRIAECAKWRDKLDNETERLAD